MSLDAARGLLACPVCALPLGPRQEGRSVGCERGHSYDVARQGYVNLLAGASPASADSAAMVAARERLLGTGLYLPIAEAVASRLAASPTVVEVGAGTGFYLAHSLDRSGGRGVAMDVSVAAARRAAHAHERAASVVADTWGTVPLLTGRLAAVLCVFAPRNLAEFARVLAPGGLLVVVTPTDSHLDGLRERYGLLGIEPGKDDRLLRSALGLFEPIARSTLDYRRPATREQVQDLIAMGPNAFHDVPEAVVPDEVRISVRVTLFRKPAA